MALEKAIQALKDESSAVTVAITIGLVLVLSLLFRSRVPSGGLPVVNGRKFFEFSDKGLKERYRTSAKELLELGLQKVSCSR